MANSSNFLKAHPFCCFCGGTLPASTIDHQPAKIIFPNKHRPKGLEFPACDECNRQTGGDEALLALLCRTAGSVRTNSKSDSSRLKDIVASVETFFPGLVQRMNLRQVQNFEGGAWMERGAIDVNQPEVNQSFCRVAAKLALAIYYETQSTPAVKECWINTLWTHSQNAETFTSVKNTIKAMPNQATLQMGRWKTDDSFFLKYLYEGGQLFLVAIFHESVALVANLCEPNAPRGEKWQFAMSPQPHTGITILKD
jgi:hypothetical protein